LAREKIGEGVSLDQSEDIGTELTPPSPRKIRADQTLQQRIAEENAKYEAGFPVAGHGEDRGRGR
jgi:hypothetical protein